jgi:transposase
MIDWAEANQLWRDGLDTHDIAAHFNVHESEIYNGFARRSKCGCGTSPSTF